MRLPTISNARYNECTNTLIGYIGSTSVADFTRIYARINGDEGITGWSLFVRDNIIASDYDMVNHNDYRNQECARISGRIQDVG